MLDLKNCPFCGGKATFAKTTKGWKVECEGRWGTCTINARTHYQPTKGQAVDAWNRRALQAVGPEPAVAVKWEQLSEIINAAVKVAIRTGSDFHVNADKLREFARSALVATPPAEPVVEAPQPANSVRGAAERVVSFDWSSNDPDAVAAVDALRAALATKPAVKDDETVVEALPNWTGWRSIDTAPEDCRVLLATAGNWVGEAIMLRDEETGEQVWTWVDTGKPSLHSCYGWMPLPEHLLAPVLSDLRPDGFDGPTGAE